ncbi:MAG: DUF1993 domain-containing protein [Pseudomonadales bacterium]|nr:DUF1993 domain-containing protein [Pseudomonadales bacterium]
MTISLYDISVASYLQVLGGANVFLDKGRSYCEENGIDLKEVVETRLYPDMLPFSFQVVSIAHHSLGAIKGVESGEFSPPGDPGNLDYAGLQKLVTDAYEALEKYDRNTVDGFEGKDIQFRMGDTAIPFTAENFVMSFSLPNLYFHSATAYDILRMKGVPIGKRHFMGRLRMNT